MIRMESNGVFIRRKLDDFGSMIYRKFAYPFVKIKIERSTNSIICKGAYLRDGCSLAGNDYIGDYTRLDNVHLGISSYIGRDSCACNMTVGNYSCIGNIQTYIGSHPIKGENISIHPAFYSTAKQYGYSYVNEQSYEETKWLDEERRIQITIGNDVWIGSGVSVLAGVRIGDGAVVGANSLVTHDIEPYAIYAGTPAKKNWF